jgi:GT2 family glycosyltransferase
MPERFQRSAPLMAFAPRVSVVVPTVRLGDRARACIAKLGQQTYRNFDVYVVSDEPDAFAVDGLTIACLASGPVAPNAKRRQAALASNADLIALLDDDAYPAPDWLEVLVRHFTSAGVVAAGGPAITAPEDDWSQRASGAVYASPLVSAAETRRYVPGIAGDVDFLPSCNLLVRRSSLIDAAREGNRFAGGEDLVLCFALRANGHLIAYDPTAIVFHHRRQLFWGHFRQVWNYAVHRGFIVKAVPAIARDARFYLPSLFVVGNVACALAPVMPRAIRGLLFGVAGTYAVVLAREALRAGRRHDADPALVALGIYLTHLTYGAGLFSGLARRDLDH